MPGKKPPFTHREMAKMLFQSSGPFHSKRAFIPAWLKIEAYNLFFTALPHVIALVIWAAIIAAIYWGVKFI